MSVSGWPLRRTAPGKAGDAPVVSFAVCRDCGADIDSWRDRLLPLQAPTFAVTERGALALQVERERVCDQCGGARAEIRVEARTASAG